MSELASLSVQGQGASDAVQGGGQAADRNDVVTGPRIDAPVRGGRGALDIEAVAAAAAEDQWLDVGPADAGAAGAGPTRPREDVVPRGGGSLVGEGDGVAAGQAVDGQGALDAVQ